MTSRKNDRGPPGSIATLVRQLSQRHSSWQVFSDFVEMAAISVSNALDFAQRDSREARYLELVRRYGSDELALFPKVMAELVFELEDDPRDALGHVFHELELHNKWTGQYFTPDNVCRMMARMTLADENDLKAKIETRGFLTACEPAVGSGAMIIALAGALKDLGVNYQQQLHVTAIDVDPQCVHMAYLQFSLLHIPAVVILGNGHTLEQRSCWYTPAHILGGWSVKLSGAGPTPEPSESMPSTEPERPQPQTRSAPPTQLKLF